MEDTSVKQDELALGPGGPTCAVCGKEADALASVWFKGVRYQVHRGQCLGKAVRRLRGRPTAAARKEE